MYDLIFYNSEPLSIERKTILVEKYPFAKFVEFDSTLTNTANLEFYVTLEIRVYN